MPVTSVVVECAPGGVGGVLEALAAHPEASVFGVENEKIVAVIEGEDPAAIGAVVDALNALPAVIGVFPVYSGGYE